MNRGVQHLDVAASIPECSGKFRALTYIGSHPPRIRKVWISCVEGLDTGADILLLDHFTPELLQEAVALNAGRANSKPPMA